MKSIKEIQDQYKRLKKDDNPYEVKDNPVRKSYHAGYLSALRWVMRE